MGRRRLWLGTVLAACLVGVAPAQAQPFVYVADGGSSIAGSSGVSQFDAIGGALSPLTPAAVTCICIPGAIAVSPDGKSVYVAGGLAGGLAGTVAQFDVGSGGALIPKTPATVASASDPTGIAVSPDGKSVYVTNFSNTPGASTVSQFDVGPSGRLTAKSPATVAAGNGPEGLAISPDGKTVYVTSIDDNTVSQYDVGAGGALTPKTPATVAAGDSPFQVAVSPDGKSVYVTDRAIFGGTVSQYNVGAGGALTPKTPATVAAGGSPCGVAVSLDGHSVYATICLAGPRILGSSVSQFDVGAGGRLTPKSTATVASGTSPFGIAVGPDGKSVYVTNGADNTVSQYDIGAGGALAPKTPAIVAAGIGPVGIAVTPLLRAPTSKRQCRHGGWRNFPQFKSRRDCLRYVKTHT